VSRLAFVDTNVWVSAVDGDEPAKQAIARRLLDPSTADALVTSAQVLGEFYVTVTRKLARPVDPADAQRMVGRMRQIHVMAIDGDTANAAIAASQRWQLSYWDALIVASAKAAGCDRLLTEDLADGAEYDGVRIVDPFQESHRVSEDREEYEVSSRTSWDDTALAIELARYEDACRAAGMRPNAIHSYWDYARRFLAWRTGEYRPRGVVAAGRPVPTGTVSAPDLERQAGAYAQAIEQAGRERPTIDTYHRHAMFFVRWLRGDFQPGARLG
jgi:predicted nucleic acid-binding protein